MPNYDKFIQPLEGGQLVLATWVGDEFCIPQGSLFELTFEYGPIRKFIDSAFVFEDTKKGRLAAEVAARVIFDLS